MPLRRILSRSTIALLVLTASAFPSARGESGTSLRGTVKSGGTGLAGVRGLVVRPLCRTPRHGKSPRSHHHGSRR